MKENILSLFRACAVCGKSWGRIRWLCETCDQKFLERVALRKRLLKPGLVHYYLLNWDIDDEFCSSIVYSLKGKGLASVFEDWARFTISHSILTNMDSIYYPSKGVRDHGWQWAFVYSKELELSIHPLQLGASEKQALLDKNHRQSREFKPLKLQGNRPLFVDDIVTTGSTVLAAYEALGQPENLTIWSLFYRRNL